MENRAAYDGSGVGIGYNNCRSAKLNEFGFTPNVGLPVADNAGSTTKSAIAPGQITLTDQKKQKQDITKLNRDTQHSLNQLGQIFDKEKVQERQEKIAVVTELGNNAIHEISAHMAAKANAQNPDSRAWRNGSEEKILLHALWGGLMASFSGGQNAAVTGALTGGATEYALGRLEAIKGTDWMLKNSDKVQWIAAGFATLVGNVTQNPKVANATALNAVKHNEYLTPEEIAEILVAR